MKKRIIKKRHLRLLVYLLFLLISALIVKYAPSEVKNEVQSQGQYKVIKVDDGDTIDVEMNGNIETVRFIGVDTPETKDPRKRVQCFGQKASQFTKDILVNSTVRLETDPQSTNRDRYDRLLRYVYKGDLLVNAEIIKTGYGFANTGFPFEKMEEFKKLEDQAKKDNQGLWGNCEVRELESGQKQTNDTN